MTRQTIQLPNRTREALADLVRERQRIDAQINAIVATARECLGVPDGYELRDVLTGFVPGAEPDEAGGVRVAGGDEE